MATSQQLVGLSALSFFVFVISKAVEGQKQKKDTAFIPNASFRCTKNRSKIYSQKLNIDLLILWLNLLTINLH